MIKDWSFILDRAIPFPHSRFWLIDVIGFPCNSVVSTSFQMIPFPIDRLLETSGRSRPIEPSYPTTTSFPFKSPFHLYSFFYSKTLRSWNAWSWKDEEYEKKKEESVDRKVNFFLFLLLFMDPKDKTYVRWQRLFKIAPHVPVAPSDNSRRQPINSTTLKQSWQLNDPGLEISILSFYSLTILSKIQRQKTQPSYPTQEVNTKRVFLMMDMIFLFSASIRYNPYHVNAICEIKTRVSVADGDARRKTEHVGDVGKSSFDSRWNLNTDAVPGYWFCVLLKSYSWAYTFTRE